MEMKSWKPTFNPCPSHRADSRVHPVELVALGKANTPRSCRTALPIPGKSLHMWQVNQAEKTLLINYHLVAPHYQVIFNLQSRPEQEEDFSPFSVLWMMICWLFLIPAGLEEVERLCYLQAFCSWAGVGCGESWILCTQEKEMDERELQPCILPELCWVEGKLHPSKSQKGRPLPNPIWRCCGAGNWPLIRDAEISGGHTSSPRNFMGDEQVKPAKKEILQCGQMQQTVPKVVLSMPKTFCLVPKSCNFNISYIFSTALY